MLLTSYPITCEDQIGISHSFNEVPSRIVSLVPSITLTLFDLGLEGSIVGRTKFCIHPKPKVKSISKIGGTKTLDIRMILSLKPDLIIANKEENEQQQIKELVSKAKVWLTDIKNIESNYEMLKSIGKITNTSKRAHGIIQNTKYEFSRLKQFNYQNIAYFIWRKPFMVAGKDTFINNILDELNLLNCIVNLNSRYPEISADQLQENTPDYIFLSSEPYPFKTKHIREVQSICPNSKVVLVDGEMFSWYGSRMVQTPQYLNKLHKELTS